MWIEFEEAIEETLTPPLSLTLRSTLETIALASFQGRHVLFGSRKTLRWLLDQKLSEPSKAAVHRALNSLAEKGAYQTRVSSRLVIVSQGLLSRQDDGSWFVPISCLENFGMPAALLMAEDRRDANAYLLAAQHYLRTEKLAAFKCELTPTNGGGNQILPNFLASIQERATLPMAVTDSDRHYPAAVSSLTSRACAEEFERAQWICNHFEVPAHELENVLPFNLVSDSITSSQVDSHLVPTIIELTALGQRVPDGLKFGDLKEGTSGSNKSISELNAAKRQFWSDVARLSGFSERSKCLENCQYQPCQCLLVPRLGDGVVDRFLRHCDGLSFPKQLERLKTSTHAHEWLEIGRVVFDWGIADQPLRA